MRLKNHFKTTRHCDSIKLGEEKKVQVGKDQEKKVQVGKDQEKAQSEKDSHSKNRGEKKPN